MNRKSTLMYIVAGWALLVGVSFVSKSFLGAEWAFVLLSLVSSTAIVVTIAVTFRPETVKEEIEVLEDKPEKVRILIADDVKEICRMVEIILNKAGYEVASCYEGAEAVRLAGEKDFDVILLDVNMPGMGGLEAVKKIKEAESEGLAHIIALTAEDEKGFDLKCLDAGYDEVLCKPIQPGKLLRKVELAVAKGRQIESAKKGKVIVSNFMQDPDYKKTIERFINDLPEKIHHINVTLEEGNLEEFAKQIHSLKGLGGLAGFPVFTEKAKRIETALSAKHTDKLRREVNELIMLCRNTKMTHK